MEVKMRLRTVAIATTAALLVTACGGGQETSSSAEPAVPAAAPVEGDDARGGVLRFGQTNDISNWDPTFLPVGDWITLHQVYDVLAVLDENLEPQPRLATNWKFSDDGLRVELNLRDDVKFHDGSPFTADSVLFNLERYKNPEVGANIRVLLNPIVEWDAPDDQTVVLTLATPMPNFFDFLDLFFIVGEQDEDSIRTKPIGTGPFVFDAWTPGDSARLTANEEYWDGAPHIDELQISIIPDPQGLVAALESGDVDLIEGLPYIDVERIRDASTAYQVKIFGDGALVSHLQVNTAVPPLDDVRVRQALNFAIDRDRINRTYYLGLSEPWCLPWPAASPAFDADLARNCPQDLNRAKQLLEEAGYGGGLELDLIIRPGSAEGVAVVLESDLKSIGVDLNIRRLSPQEANPLLVAGDYELFAHEHGRTNRHPLTASGASRPFWPTGNFGQFENADYVALINQLREEGNVLTQQQIYNDLNALIRTESFSITIAPITRAFAWKTSVSGITANADGQLRLQQVRVSN